MPDVFAVFLNKDDDDETSGADVFSSGKKLRKTLRGMAPPPPLLPCTCEG